MSDDIKTDHLGERGLRLFEKVTEEFDLGAGETETLLLAAETLDKIAKLDAIVAEEGLVITSPQGRKTNPAQVESRALTLLFDKLMRSLNVPMDDE